MCNVGHTKQFTVASSGKPKRSGAALLLKVAMSRPARLVLGVHQILIHASLDASPIACGLSGIPTGNDCTRGFIYGSFHSGTVHSAAEAAHGTPTGHCTPVQA